MADTKDLKSFEETHEGSTPSPRTFQYQDDEGVHRFTEDDIIKTYYPWWCEQMKKANKEQFINKQNCIEDWVVVNWAVEV